MEAEGWNEVVELLANTAWTSQDLEEKHGVSNIETLLAADNSADMRHIRCYIILLYLYRSILGIISFHLLLNLTLYYFI